VTVGLVVILAIVGLPLIERLLTLYWKTPQDADIPHDIKAMVSDDLLELLSSRNAPAVAYAVRELGKRREVKAIPKLIRVLNNRDPVVISGSGESTSPARLAATALSAVTRRQIEIHPGNVAILRPLFESAHSGTAAERAGALAVLTRLREPFAAQMTAKPEDPGAVQLRDPAASAVRELQRPHKDDVVWVVLRRTETVYLAGLCAIILVGLGTMTAWIFRRTPAKFILLLCIPVVLMVWITILAGIDFSMGIAVDGAIDKAVRNGDFLALKTMLYDEYVPYPGDSPVARYLVRKGNDTVVYCLTGLPGVGPDDDKNYRKFLSDRTDWILSRIVSIKLRDGTFQELTDGNLPGVGAALAVTLGKLGIRNKSILEALERLSLDSDEEVRGKAAKALTLVNKYPVWNWEETGLPPQHR
ncbi:MAG: hypothetical protein V1792_17540, partial [Pseudomonadota bacterium]